MKTCKVCNLTGDNDLFIKNRRICRGCYSVIQANYRNNSDKNLVRNYNKEYSVLNEESIKSQRKKYYENNSGILLEKQKTYYQNNKEKIKSRNSNYRKSNRDKRNITETNRRLNDPSYKLRVYFSRDVFRSVKSKNQTSTFDILPYSVIELRKHLESQFEPWMSWSNHGKYVKETWDDNDVTTWTWQIDHIIPRSKFNYTDISDLDFIKCWSLSNLRPLSSKDNLINGSKLNRRKK